MHHCPTQSIVIIWQILYKLIDIRCQKKNSFYHHQSYYGGHLSRWQCYLVSGDRVWWWEGHRQSTGFHMGTGWCCLLGFQCSSAEVRCRGPAEGYLSPHCPAWFSLQQEKTFSQRQLQEIHADLWILLWSILRVQSEARGDGCHLRGQGHMGGVTNGASTRLNVEQQVSVSRDVFSLADETHRCQRELI